jgi:hypothetical protein
MIHQGYAILGAMKRRFLRRSVEEDDLSRQKALPEHPEIQPPPVNDREALLRSDDWLPSSRVAPDHGLKAGFRLLNPLRVLLILLILVVVFLAWLFYAGPGRPTLESVLVSLARRPTPTSTPTSTRPAATATQVKPSATVAPSRTPTRPRPTDTLTPEVVVSPTSESGCLDVLAITLEDVGETACVEGTILRAEEHPNGFLIIFSDQKNAFYLVSYDLVWKQADEGLCIRTTGKIQQIGNSPVMVFGYSNLPEVCSVP